MTPSEGDRPGGEMRRRPPVGGDRTAGQKRAPAAGGRRKPATGKRPASSTEARPRERGRAGGAPARERARVAPRLPVPPMTLGLVRALQSLAGSPALVVVTLLGVLVVWLLYAALVPVAAVQTLGVISAISVVHSFFDVELLQSVARVVPVGWAFALAALVVAVRAAVADLVIALVLEWAAGRGRPSPARDTLMRALRAYPVVLALETVSFLATSFVVGPFFGLAALFGAVGLLVMLGALVAALYLLVMAPIVAVTERRGPIACLRLGSIAARTRGHLTLVVTYVMAVVLLFLATQGRADAPVTPPWLVWTYALVAALAQTVVLAMFVVRWLFVREAALAFEADRRGERRAARRPARRTAGR